jgi:hypothetical protein
MKKKEENQVKRGMWRKRTGPRKRRGEEEKTARTAEKEINKKSWKNDEGKIRGK